MSRVSLGFDIPLQSAQVTASPARDDDKSIAAGLTFRGDSLSRWLILFILPILIRLRAKYN